MIRDKTDEWEARVDRERNGIRGEFADEDIPPAPPPPQAPPQLGEGKYPDGNPKTQFGIVKPGNWHTPTIPYYEYSMAHLQGALKYGAFNWRDDPISISTYIEAAERHINLFKDGQRNASDTGIHHLAHAICCFSIIIDAEYHHTLIDDRKTTIRHGAKTDSPGFITEDYLKEAEGRVKKIREEWTGFAERRKLKETLDKIPNEGGQ